jgi:uncharacterized protein YkwD
MKYQAWVGIFLVTAILLVLVQPTGVTYAGDASTKVLTAVSHRTERGSARGSTSALAIMDQSGSADKPSTYVSLMTPRTSYRGYINFKLPTDIRPSSLNSMQLMINYKSLPANRQIWTWKLYNWTNGNWVIVGDNAAAKKDRWTYSTFSLGNPVRFISNRGELRLQLISGDSGGDAKLDYVAIKVGYGRDSTPVPTNTPWPTKTVAPVTATAVPTSTPVPTDPPARIPTNPPAAPTNTALPAPTITSQPSPTSTSSSACAANNQALETKLLELINHERTNNGLPALKSQSQLAVAARKHSADMACNNYISHTGSDGSTSKERIEREGYQWSWAGENIAGGFTTPENVMQLWMNSAPHKANILSPNYVEAGVGYAYSGSSAYGSYWTVDFAKPK